MDGEPYNISKGMPDMSFVITGSVAYDYLMRYPGRFRDQILPDQLDNISLSFLAHIGNLMYMIVL